MHIGVGAVALYALEFIRGRKGPRAAPRPEQCETSGVGGNLPDAHSLDRLAEVLPRPHHDLAAPKQHLSLAGG